MRSDVDAVADDDDDAGIGRGGEEVEIRNLACNCLELLRNPNSLNMGKCAAGFCDWRSSLLLLLLSLFAASSSTSWATAALRFTAAVVVLISCTDRRGGCSLALDMRNAIAAPAIDGCSSLMVSLLRNAGTTMPTATPNANAAATLKMQPT